MSRYWTCPKCGTRNERIKQRCWGVVRGSNGTESCRAPRPKKRVPVHARTLRDDPYEVFERVNREIHGAELDCCGVCGKPPTTARHMDRDHDHVTGKPRGLACPGNTGCNALMPRQLDLARARLIVAYLERVEEHYSRVESCI